MNLTSPARATVRGDLFQLYADLVHAQHASYNAWIDLGDAAVLSLSPELFFDWTPPRLRCRPMKGTARRGAGAPEQDPSGDQLWANPKDRAENVMIVDLVRNDLSRIARTGSVRSPGCSIGRPSDPCGSSVPRSCASPARMSGLLDVFSALFPSGSITGAPKAAAARIIDEVEAAPRGVYCGAIGWVAPPPITTPPFPALQQRARFSVAIRTATVQRSSGSAVYGAGGGITAAFGTGGRIPGDARQDRRAVPGARRRRA